MAQLQTASLIVVFVTLLAEALAIFRPMVDLVVSHTAELLRLSQTDELTQSANRRAFYEAAEIELQRSRRLNRLFSILMIDVDHFKRVNDTYGHASGDIALRSVSAHIRKMIRPFDTLGRLGGEEFAVLVPETNHEAALALADRIRRSVATLSIDLPNQELRVTISIGVASFHHDVADASALVALADTALYVAKSKGRNRVISAVTEVNPLQDDAFTPVPTFSSGSA